MKRRGFAVPRRERAGAVVERNRQPPAERGKKPLDDRTRHRRKQRKRRRPENDKS